MLSREPGAMRAAIWPRKPASHKDGSTPGEKGSRNTASKPEQGEGQAAGTAAAMCVERRIDAREFPVDLLRERLVKDGAVV